MKKPVPPCLKCEERRQFCHAECEKYKSFRSALDKYKDHVSEKNKVETMLTAYECTRATHLRKKYD